MTQEKVEAPAAEEPKKAEDDTQAYPSRDELAARREQIVTRVKALGWRPFQDVALEVLGRVASAVDGFLTGLEGGDNSRKKR